MNWRNSALIKNAQSGNLELVKYLIEKCNSDIEYKQNGISALIICVTNGDLKMVKYLVKNGANITEQHLAASAIHGHTKILKYLIKKNKIETTETTKTRIHIR